MMKRPYMTLGLMALFAVALALPAFALQGMNTNAKQEISTAQAHALMASNASKLKMVHAHLQHAVNCLVGSDGKAFDASAMNPCKGMGHGALADTVGHHRLHSLLSKALEKAQNGINAGKIEAARQAASKTAELLKEAQTDDYRFEP